MASSERAARVEANARHNSWGADTSRLYYDTGSAKRLPTLPVDTDRAAGKALVTHFRRVLPLDGVPRQELVRRHRGELEAMGQQRGKDGELGRRRLAELDAAEQRLAGLVEVGVNVKHALDDAEGAFISTVDGLPHGTRTRLPKIKPKLHTPHDVGALNGIAPGVSPHARLYYHSRKPKDVVSFSPDAVVHNPQGTLIMDDAQEFVSCMLPTNEWLTADEHTHFERLIKDWFYLSPNLPRGESHTACYEGFVGGQLKFDTYGTRTAMPYSMMGLSWKQREHYAHLQNELRSFFRKIHKKVIKYVNTEFISLTTPMWEAGVDLCLGFEAPLTSATAGKTFWNIAHTDGDLGFTILVAVGSVTGGGAFVHPSVGVGHDVRPGSIMVVNPAKMHCTSAFVRGEGDTGRAMCAVFCKESVVLGAGTAVAQAKREGREVWKPPAQCRKRRRKKD